MSLTKKDIADKLYEAIDINQTKAMSITKYFFKSIKNSLANGETVKLSGFGNFVVKEKSSRVGRNPKTGEPVTVSARKVVSFKAGPKLKKIILESV